MEEIEWGVPVEIIGLEGSKFCGTLAAGLFGREAFGRRMGHFQSVHGYVRELEQLPNFAIPSIDQFMRNYVQSYSGIITSHRTGYC